MKKLSTICLSFALTFLSYSTQAQETSDRILPRIGIKGGVNLSNFFTQDIDDENALIGFNAGLFVKMPVAKSFSIQPELYYITKGSEVSYNNLFATGNARFRLSYLEMPVLLVWNINSNFNIHGGPCLAYLLNGAVSNTSSAPLFDFEKNIDINDYNKMDASIAVGAAIDIRKISIGVRYNYGVSTIGKERDYLGNTYRFPDAKNSVLNVYAAISLN